jgi:DNA-binding MarR family transcriptional regulator
VISIAHYRRYSPSDEELLGQLNIKRARLSQISNRLLKAGILSVHALGRNRYYELTQAARAQLIAWNVIGGEN